MAHLLYLIPPADAMTLWRKFDEQKSACFERICNVPRSAAARLQALLPHVFAGMVLFAAVDISSCAYFGRLIQSANVREISCKHAPKIDHIFADAQQLLVALKPSLAAAPNGVLLPCDSLLLSNKPEFIQYILSRALFQRKLREASRKYDFQILFCDTAKKIPLHRDFTKDWTLLYTRKRVLALLCPGANTFLSTKPDDTSFFSQDM